MESTRALVGLPLAAAAACVPACLGTLIVAAFSVLDLSGQTPFSGGPLQNIAEAAADGNAAEVLRRMAAGDNLGRVWPVRPEIISSSVPLATGLEAAVWSREGALVRLLDLRHAIGEGEIRHHLVCLALDIDAEEVADVLAGNRELSCEPGEALRVVLKRAES